MKTMVNGAASVEQVPTSTSSDAGIQKDPALKALVDKLKPTAVKDRSHDLEEVRNSNANGELRDDPGVGKEKPVNHREDEAGDKIRDKDRDRQRLRESRDSGRGYDAERERARGRDRDRERRDREREREERENTKERDYRRKERGRDVGESEIPLPIFEGIGLSWKGHVAFDSRLMILSTGSEASHVKPGSTGELQRGCFFVGCEDIEFGCGSPSFLFIRDLTMSSAAPVPPVVVVVVVVVVVCIYLRAAVFSSGGFLSSRG